MMKMKKRKKYRSIYKWIEKWEKHLKAVLLILMRLITLITKINRSNRRNRRNESKKLIEMKRYINRIKIIKQKHHYSKMNLKFILNSLITKFFSLNKITKDIKTFKEITTKKEKLLHLKNIANLIQTGINNKSLLKKIIQKSNNNTKFSILMRWTLQKKKAIRSLTMIGQS